ncbi:MAG: hypothetical protein GY909_16985 [Oligoflexia bacterium]|nr:hypothetical protein [Oligoflexia bacterium]
MKKSLLAVGLVASLTVTPALADELLELMSQKEQILKDIAEVGPSDRLEGSLKRIDQKIKQLKAKESKNNSQAKAEAARKAKEEARAKAKAMLAKLKAEKEAREREIKEREAKNSHSSRSVASESSSDAMKFKGSLRYRMERIDKRGSDLRNRHRVQAKISVSRKLNKYFKGSIGLASGSTDPVSTNQSLDGSFTTKSFNLDTAVIAAKVAGQKIQFGKMKNPIYVPGGSELVWDGDVRPEGTHGNFKYEIKDTMIGLNLGQFWVEENSSAEETYLTTGQFLLSHKFKPVKITLGAGVYSYDNLDEKSTLVDATDSFGNSTDANGKYATNYKMFNYFVEFKFKVASIPFTLYYDAVSNSKATADDKGSAFGLKVGKAKKRNSWQFMYIYKKVEKDAVVGALSDSDFQGGGTDGKGSEFGVAYAVMDNTTIGLSHFMNETSLTQSASKDYDRTQLDLKIKF